MLRNSVLRFTHLIPWYVFDGLECRDENGLYKDGLEILDKLQELAWDI